MTLFQAERVGESAGDPRAGRSKGSAIAPKFVWDFKAKDEVIRYARERKLNRHVGPVARTKGKTRISGDRLSQLGRTLPMRGGFTGAATP